MAHASCRRYRVRERLSGGSAEVVYCHMLFHLAHPFFRGKKCLQVVRTLERLIDRHGNGNYADYTLKLTFPRNPNGVYFLKGGERKVWRKFGVPQIWRKPQGLIFGKRCGSTENIGPTARKLLSEQQDRSKVDTSKNSRAANSACLFGRLDSGLFPVRF